MERSQKAGLCIGAVLRARKEFKECLSRAGSLRHVRSYGVDGGQLHVYITFDSFNFNTRLIK
jgi:hypothetical protein